jgi:hypothetical protein
MRFYLSHPGLKRLPRADDLTKHKCLDNGSGFDWKFFDRPGGK